MIVQALTSDLRLRARPQGAQTRLPLRALLLAALALTTLASAQAGVTNTVQANFGVAGPLPFFSTVGDSFNEVGTSTSYTTLASSIVGSTVGAIDGSQVTVNGTNYNFYDDYEFTMPGQSGNLSASAISVSFTQLTGISNLQARVYSVTGNNGLTTLAPVGGATYAWSSSLNSGSTTVDITDFGTPVSVVAGNTYVLELRGLVQGSSASYGGSLTINPVPESSGLALGLAGLGLVCTQARRRRA